MSYKLLIGMCLIGISFIVESAPAVEFKSNAYLGKPPAQQGGDKESTFVRKPISVLKPNTAQHVRESKKAFWDNYPHYSMASKKQAAFPGGMTIVGDYIPRPPSAMLSSREPKVVHGLVATSSNKDSEKANDRVILFPEIKSKDSKSFTFHYEESKKGWARYGNKTVEYSEYLPVSSESLASLDNISFKSVLRDAFLERYGLSSDAPSYDFEYLSKAYESTSGFYVSDFCLKDGNSNRAVFSRSWVSDDHELLKFIIVNSSGCHEMK